MEPLTGLVIRDLGALAASACGASCALCAESLAKRNYTGGVSNIKIILPRLDELSLGQLLYFFEKACGISGYMLGVNPFDQPGVEAYKKNMFALLNKPGYEAGHKAMMERI